MRSHLLPLGLGLFGAVLPGWVLAQDYPGGLNIPPIPVVPGVYPGGAFVTGPRTPQIDVTVTRSVGPQFDVNVTGSVGPRVMPAFPEGEPVARRGCDVQSYTFGFDRPVRVYRC
jgi:hypothetical protein